MCVRALKVHAMGATAILACFYSVAATSAIGCHASAANLPAARNSICMRARVHGLDLPLAS